MPLNNILACRAYFIKSWCLIFTIYNRLYCIKIAGKTIIVSPNFTKLLVLEKKCIKSNAEIADLNNLSKIN